MPTAAGMPSKKSGMKNHPGHGELSSMLRRIIPYGSPAAQSPIFLPGNKIEEGNAATLFCHIPLSFSQSKNGIRVDIDPIVALENLLLTISPESRLPSVLLQIIG